MGATTSKKAKQSQTVSHRFRAIWDKYTTLDQVQEALRDAGLESSNLILGVDMTKSNTWTGKHSFGGKNLHTISETQPNFYEQTISIIGRTLAPFDDDDLIPVYGFGDATTHDKQVFSFNVGDRPFHGFSEVIARYRDLVSNVKLSGPTSFAPIINRAAHIAASTGEYHILVIIADGQVTRPSDTPDGEFSEFEQATADAIVAASNTPLSIVVVGVGDGPWDMMQHFDDHLPQRKFDNFQFVDYGAVVKHRDGDTTSRRGLEKIESRFALTCLMEIPDQYKAIRRLRLGRSSFRAPAPLDPPATHKKAVTASFRDRHAAPPSGSGGPAAGYAYPATGAAYPVAPAAAAYPSGGAYASPAYAAPAYPTGASAYGTPAAATTVPPPRLGGDEAMAKQLESMQDQVTCGICLERRKNIVFQCGHQTCDVCSPTLSKCPFCRQDITTRIKMF